MPRATDRPPSGPKKPGTRRGQASYEKIRIPAERIVQRPGEPPLGNGGVRQPAVFPPHN